MKLELKHLAPYLPYGLKVQSSKTETLIGILENKIFVKEFNLAYPFGNCIPILRPISEIEEYFEKLYGMLEHQDVTDFFDVNFLDAHDSCSIEEMYVFEPESLPYGTFQVLCKHHFDVFGLIPIGLAVSIHDVDQVIA